MKSKVLIGGAAVVVAAVAAYWYWSPLLAVRDMQAAAQAGDADALNARIDYPQVREQLKADLKAQMVAQFGPGGPKESAFALTLGSGMVDKMLDVIVQPSSMMAVMRQGKATPAVAAEGVATPAPAASAPAPRDDNRVVWTAEREGVNRYVLYGRKPEETEAQRTGFVMSRHGFADWKLTALRLPTAR